MNKIGILGISFLVILTLMLSGCGENVSGEAKGGKPGAPKTQCSDGLDNDADGFCDFLQKKTRCKDGSTPGDLDCESKEDDNEAADCIPVPETCDGMDNNCNDEIDEGLSIECTSSTDCGVSGYSGPPYCKPDGNAYQEFINYSCNSPGTCASSCSSQTSETLYQTCPAGCMNGTCLPETSCGDGYCNGGETAATCPQDCGYPDSCVETDGGWFPNTFGIVSGYLNNQPYNNPDYCVDNTTIMEYWCGGNRAFDSVYNCAQNMTIACVAGRCV